MRARIGVVAVALLLAALTAEGADRCAKIRKRYARLCPSPMPAPTPSPAPTVEPPDLPCEAVGTLTMEPGKSRMLCFDVGPGTYPFVNVKSSNHGNASCSELEMELWSPTGQRSYSVGPQPGTVLPRAVGRWYVWLNETWAAQPDCHSYTFTVVK